MTTQPRPDRNFCKIWSHRSFVGYQLTKKLAEVSKKFLIAIYEKLYILYLLKEISSVNIAFPYSLLFKIIRAPMIGGSKLGAHCTEVTSPFTVMLWLMSLSHNEPPNMSALTLRGLYLFQVYLRK